MTDTSRSFSPALFLSQCLAQFDQFAVQQSRVVLESGFVFLRVYFSKQFAFLIEVFHEFEDGPFAEAEFGSAKMADEQQDGELAVLNLIIITIHLRRKPGRMLKIVAN